jgi:hypothetical protein
MYYELKYIFGCTVERLQNLARHQALTELSLIRWRDWARFTLAGLAPGLTIRREHIRKWFLSG